MEKTFSKTPRYTKNTNPTNLQAVKYWISNQSQLTYSPTYLTTIWLQSSFQQLSKSLVKYKKWSFHKSEMYSDWLRYLEWNHDNLPTKYIPKIQNLIWISFCLHLITITGRTWRACNNYLCDWDISYLYTLQLQSNDIQHKLVYNF